MLLKKLTADMLMMFYRVNECTLPFNGAKNETFHIKKLLKSSVFFYAKQKMLCHILNNCVLILENGLVCRLNEKKAFVWMYKIYNKSYKFSIENKHACVILFCILAKYIYVRIQIPKNRWCPIWCFFQKISICK